MSAVAAQSLLVFPCDFPLKIMGVMRNGFAESMVAIVLRHAPDFLPQKVEMRPSRGGNYVSLTCIIRAQSQAQLDALYRELTAHPEVRFVL